MTAAAILPMQKPVAAVTLPATAVPPSSLTVGDTLWLVWRRKVLFAATLVLGTAIAALIAFSLQPRYTASVLLLLEADKRSGAAELGIPSVLGGSSGGISNEVEVLRSPRFAEAVIDSLGLWSDPEFNEPEKASQGFFGPVVDALEAVPALVGLSPADLQADADPRLSRRLKVLRKFHGRIGVRPIPPSNVVEIRFESEDPAKAAAIANTMAETYILQAMKTEAEVAEKKRAWLAERVDKMREEMVATERAVADFTVSSGVVEIGKVSVTDRQINEASSQFMQARAHRAEIEARLGAVRRALAGGDGGESLAEVRNSSLIQRLKVQETQVLRKLSELSSNYGERHPRIIDVRTELGDLRTKIRDEISRIVEGLRNEQKIALERENSLRGVMAQLRRERAVPVRDQVELRKLEREAAVSRGLYEKFLARLTQVSQEDTLRDPPAEVMSPARPPVDPSFPRKHVIIGLGLIVSFLFGVVLVLVIDRMRTGFRSAAQIEEEAQLYLLGAVPRLPRRPFGKDSPAEQVVTAAGSGYAEAVRSLRTALSVSRPEGPPRIVHFASSLSGEGKTSLVVSMARQAALSSVSGGVILIDGDLRRPMVARTMGIDCTAGLMNLFAGEASLDDIIKVDPQTGLHVIPAPSGTANPPELLNSLNMRDLLDELTRRYDLVILDSPAMNSVSDARVLAKLADATVFVVQWDKTPRKVALAAIRQLQRTGAPIAGIVLQQVDDRSLDDLGYTEVTAY